MVAAILVSLFIIYFTIKSNVTSRTEELTEYRPDRNRTGKYYQSLSFRNAFDHILYGASDCIDRKWCDTVLWFDSVFGTRTDLPVVDFGCADRSVICIKTC